MRVFGLLTLTAGLSMLGWMGAVSFAGEPAAGETILSSQSYLRAWLAYRTPVQIDAKGEIRPVADPTSKEGKPIGDFQSPLPPAGWMQPEYDDSGWDRLQGAVEAGRGGATGNSQAARHTATVNSALFLRGKFLVEDPSQARDLRLTVEYVGGLVVYLNGQEIARAHLPSPSAGSGQAGELKPETLAEKYPDDLHCEAGGLYLENPAKNQAGFDRRYRKLADVVVPARLFRKGTNVLALDLRRAPLNEAAVNAKRVASGGMSRVSGMWAYVGLKSLILTGEPGSGVQASVGRPAGIQVWNAASFETVSSTSYGEAGVLRPVLIQAARNGVFSGRLMVSSGQAIKGLKVLVEDLASGEGAKLPTSAVRVRCAEPALAGKSHRTVWNWRHHLFDGLLDAIPAEIPLLHGSAMAPLWFTVRVPKDAKPGRYDGKVTVQAEGLAATVVPMALIVHDWALPDPRDFRVRHTGVLSPDSLALHYKVPYWSERHFEMMRRSMGLMGELNSRQINVHLRTDFLGGGNSHQSIVRWIKQPDGSYTHDLTILDKYLDLVDKTIGKPLPIRFNCWGQLDKKNLSAPGGNVSLLDPKTGELTPLPSPPVGTEESYAFWKPVIDEVRKRLEKRGWLGVASVGHNSYCYPVEPAVVDVARRLWPDGAWSYTAHNGTLGGFFAGTKPGERMPVTYSECVWTQGELSPRGYQALFKPGRDTMIWNSAARDAHGDTSPLSIFLQMPENMIMRGHDGIGYLSAELFPVENANKPGKFHCLSIDRGGVAGGTTKALLAPGVDGPIATERFEMVREGVQLCEAILFLQRALDSKAIAGLLGEKVNAYLTERGEAFIRNWGSGRVERDQRLLSLCDEVAKSGGAKP